MLKQMMLRSRETETIRMTLYEVGKHEESHSETIGGGRRWVALYVLCVGMLMIVLDATVVNVAFRTTSVSHNRALRGSSTPT
jgi:hypothetical protein